MVTASENNVALVSDEFRYQGNDSDIVLKASMGNTSEDNRVLWCTTLAAISRGREYSQNPNVRYKQLLKEAAPNNAFKVGSPSRPLEFIPVVLDCIWRHDIDSVALKMKDDIVSYLPQSTFINTLAKFGFISNEDGSKEFKLRTNMRAILNAGLNYDWIPYNTEEECNDFKAVKIRAPMFVFNHLVTHTMLSKEARSERVVDYSNEVLNTRYPEPFNKPFWKPAEVSDDMLQDFLYRMSFVDVIEKLKELGLPKEIYQRAILEWRFKDFIMVGWNEDVTWKHLFLERGATSDYENWTQKETKETVVAIKTTLGL